VARVIYAKPTSHPHLVAGALGSRHLLHTLAQLNHQYRVFRRSEEEEGQQEEKKEQKEE
jgi:hypothetical protein